MANKPEPTAEEVREAEARIKALDRLAPRCQWDRWAVPFDAELAREQWKRIMKLQDEYEAKYA